VNGDAQSEAIELGNAIDRLQKEIAKVLTGSNTNVSQESRQTLVKILEMLAGFVISIASLRTLVWINEKKKFSSRLSLSDLKQQKPKRSLLITDDCELRADRSDSSVQPAQSQVMHDNQ